MSPDADGLPTRADVQRTLLVLDSLPELIVARRERLGHSMRTAATKLGIPHNNLSRIENRLHTELKASTIEKLLTYVLEGKR